MAYSFGRLASVWMPSPTTPDVRLCKCSLHLPLTKVSKHAPAQARNNGEFRARSFGQH